MMRRALPSLLALGLALLTSSGGAAERSFVYTHESHVHPPGETVLEPWTTLLLGREHYFSQLEGRLKLEHGLSPGLQLALFWNFQTVTQDVVTDNLTGELERVTDSQLASASLELKYQLSDASADLLGSALHLEATLGPSDSELELDLIADRKLARWLLAGHLSLDYELSPVRGPGGSELATSLTLEPNLAVAYALTPALTLGLELRAPFDLTAERSALFAGPVLGFSDATFWAVLGVQPQLVAFAGQSRDSHLDLSERERVHVRLIAGFLL